MKKLLSLILCAALLVGCSSTNTTEDDQSQDYVQTPSTAGLYQAGVYTGTADGNNGPVTVEVTFSANAIEKIEIVSQEETESIASKPLEEIPAAILEAQSTSVDTVSGATNTSKAIINAVNDCIVQAGGKADTSSLFDEGENLETDIVIVGSGLAGLTAALTAAENGNKVLLVEKQGVIGGDALLTGAGIYAVETKAVPKSLEDKDEMYEHILDMIDDGGTLDHVDLDRIRHLVDVSDETIAWLESLGMEFTAGSVGILNAKDHYHSLADGSMGAGQVEIMKAACDKAGVEIMLQTKCVEIVKENDLITGIIVEDSNSNTRYTINAKAVILTSGGYAHNQEMMLRYMPASLASITLAEIGATGEVIDQAIAVGADIYPYQFMLSCGSTTDMSVGLDMMSGAGAFVNSKGHRFCNEQKLWQVDAEMIKGINDAPYYVIYDSKHITDANLEALNNAVAAGNPYVLKAETLEALATKAHFEDVEGFVKEINAYSKAAEEGIDDPAYGVPNNLMVPATDGPFFAVLIYSINAGTIGGIKTNVDGEVLDSDGNAIKGLYAAGEISNGDLYDNGYISGTSILNCYVAGKDAGNAASRFVKE